MPQPFECGLIINERDAVQALQARHIGHLEFRYLELNLTM